MTYPPFLTSSLWLGLRVIKDPAPLGREKPRNQCPGKKITNTRIANRIGQVGLTSSNRASSCSKLHLCLSQVRAFLFALPGVVVVVVGIGALFGLSCCGFVWAPDGGCCGFGDRTPWSSGRPDTRKSSAAVSAGLLLILARCGGPDRAHEAGSRASQALNWEQWIRGFVCSSFKNSHIRRLTRFPMIGNLVQGNKETDEDDGRVVTV